MQVLKPEDYVRIKSGPFASFTGVVKDVDLARGELKVSVENFGQEMMIEVPISEAEKSLPPPPPSTSLN